MYTRVKKTLYHVAIATFCFDKFRIINKCQILNVLLYCILVCDGVNIIKLFNFLEKHFWRLISFQKEKY